MNTNPSTSQQPTLDSEPELVFSEANLRLLQQTRGNTYVNRMVQRSMQDGTHGKGCGCSICAGGRVQRSTVDAWSRRGQPPMRGTVQRDLMSAADWKTRSRVADSGEAVKGGRSIALRSIDSALTQYHKHRGFPERNFGLSAITSLRSAIKAWQKKKDGESQRLTAVSELDAEATKESNIVVEMVEIKKRLSSDYGIELDNTAGIKSITRLYRSFGGRKKDLKALTAARWTLKELQGVETAVKRYSPLLGDSRDEALGDQTITTFSRLVAAADVDDSGKVYVEGEGGTDLGTFAETFTQTIGGQTLSNVGVFDLSASVTDFAGDPHNPTPEELEKGYVGTITHELSHGLIEMLPAPADAPDYPARGGKPAKPVGDMLNHFANSISYWRRPNRKSGAADAEEPITGYGKTNANEDMAEAIMFFFEEPGELQSKCPQRYNFITENLQSYLNPDEYKKATDKAKEEHPELNPPPLPPALGGGDVAPAAGGGGITPEALQEGKAGLKPVPPPMPEGGLPVPAVGGAGGGITPEALQEGKENLKPVPEGGESSEGGEVVAMLEAVLEGADKDGGSSE